MAESREEIEQALAALGWEVRTDESGAIMGAHGKHYVMVSFLEGDPASLTISYVGRGGEILSRAWPGVNHLPPPRSVVRRLKGGSKE